MICLGESEYFRYNHPDENEIIDAQEEDFTISNSDNTSESTGSFKSLNNNSANCLSSTSEKTSNDMSANDSFFGEKPSKSGQLLKGKI